MHYILDIIQFGGKLCLQISFQTNKAKIVVVSLTSAVSGDGDDAEYILK